MWIEAPHYLSSLRGSNQSAPTSCCGGTLRTANNAHMICIAYVLTTPAGLTRGFATFIPPHARADMYTAHTRCQTHTVFSRRSQQRHGDCWINMGIRDEDANTNSNTRCPAEQMYSWQACLVWVVPKEIRVIFLSDDNESVFLVKIRAESDVRSWTGGAGVCVSWAYRRHSTLWKYNEAWQWQVI